MVCFLSTHVSKKTFHETSIPIAVCPFIIRQSLGQSVHKKFMNFSLFSKVKGRYGIIFWSKLFFVHINQFRLFYTVIDQFWLFYIPEMCQDVYNSVKHPKLVKMH